MPVRCASPAAGHGAGMPDRFDTCLPFTLAQECPLPRDWSNPKNFSNDAHDPGGETQCGITQREYDHWRKRYGEPCRDVRQLTQIEGDTVYRQNYWHPYCQTLPPGLDLQVFDASVNEGPTEATRIMQRVLGLVVDGLWGPKTAAAVAGIRDIPGVIRAYTARRRAVYQMMPGFKYFGHGWLKRANEIGAQALQMAAEAKPQEPPMTTTAPAPAAPNAFTTAADVLAKIQEAEPWIERVLPLMPYGAQVALIVHFVDGFESGAEAALRDLGAANGGNIFQAAADFFNHITPGQPNAPALSPSAPPVMSTVNG